MIIKNGIISTAADSFIADIRIDNGLIQQIGKELPSDGEEIIDASGMHVLPGGVDAHTHFDLDVGSCRAVDDFYTGTVAACCGGTTTIIDHMGFGPKDCGLSHQLEVYHKLAAGNAVIDYGFHGVIQHVNQQILDEMAELIVEGLTSYKIYLTYDFKIEDLEAFEVIKRIKELGLMLTVHPENDGMIKNLKADYLSRNLKSAIYHAKSRPVECEAESINKILNMCKVAGDAPIYIVHLSNGLGLDYINFSRERGQKNIYAETCPQYLLLNEDAYNRPDGIKYIMSPPLRSRENNELLWKGLELGQIDTVATDHCPFNYMVEKQYGAEDFSKCPNGAAGVECRVPLMFSEGVMKNRITLNQMVALCSTNPAKLFGCYPQKGSIAPGSDADLVIINPNRELTITKGLLHENVDYTVYEGIKATGWPEMTIVQGSVAAKHGQFLGRRGTGRFIKRAKPTAL